MYRKNNITPIEELPELDDIEFNHLPSQPNVNKFIRLNSNFLPKNSGMNFLPPPKHNFPSQNFNNNQEQSPLSQKYQPNIRIDPHPHFEERNYQEPVVDIKNYINNPPQKHSDLSCILISHHVKHCPICSRLYNTDRTIYLIIIFFLCLLCLILIKKILNI